MHNILCIMLFRCRPQYFFLLDSTICKCLILQKILGLSSLMRKILQFLETVTIITRSSSFMYPRIFLARCLVNVFLSNFVKMSTVRLSTLLSLSLLRLDTLYWLSNQQTWEGQMIILLKIETIKSFKIIGTIENIFSILQKCQMPPWQVWSPNFSETHFQSFRYLILPPHLNWILFTTNHIMVAKTITWTVLIHCLMQIFVDHWCWQGRAEPTWTGPWWDPSQFYQTSAEMIRT